MQNEPLKITVLTTGGTIEKIYDERGGNLENRGTLRKKNILSKLRLPYTKIFVKSVMAKDSLHLTDEDRQIVIEEIKRALSKNTPVVILHGTDTMSVTAELAAKEIPGPKFPVIFTGAMRPMGFEDTDATQNVTEAFLAAKILAGGHYIIFHNRVFTVPNVRKNHTLGTFESYLD